MTSRRITLKSITDDGFEGYMFGTGRKLNSELEECFYYHPTLQMAMKWLREVHKMYMYVAHDSMENTWFARVYNDYKTLSDVDNHSTYEEACEMAINIVWKI